MTKAGVRNLWATRVAEFKASGQSVPAWCSDQDVKTGRLRYWLNKERTDTS